MTDHDTEESKEGITRRSILQRGTIATGVALVGVGAISGTVAASQCPRTPGYWMNHDWPGEGFTPGPDGNTGLDQVNERIPRITFQTEAAGQEYLKQPAKGDKGYIMSFHLIATILNFQLAGSAKKTCFDAGVEVKDVTGDGEPETMRQIKQLAEDWLDASNFPSEQSTWYVPSATVPDGEILKDLLDRFNNDRLLVCNCTDEEKDETKPSDRSARGQDRS